MRLTVNQASLTMNLVSLNVAEGGLMMTQGSLTVNLVRLKVKEGGLTIEQVGLTFAFQPSLKKLVSCPQISETKLRL